jgi:serine/threonine protein kinase
MRRTTPGAYYNEQPVKHLGPYELVRQLAAGGMAEVHLAKSTGIAGFEKQVAIKLIHASLSEQPDAVDMLVDEAKLAVKLAHPNIAQIYDLGYVDGSYYIAMEYVEGVDLSQLVRAAKGELPFDVCAAIAKDIASALDHAHQKSVIHRDVSPHNVLLSFDGQVKLVDFGIAKAMASARRTEIGVVKGKYAYMSPEQARDEPVDARSDIYSAGMVLFQMLTGHTLHEEADLEQLVARVRHGALVPPSKFRAGVPSEIEDIAVRALAVRAQDRYQRASAMALDLQHYLYAASPSFVPATLELLIKRLLGGSDISTTVPGTMRVPEPVMRRDSTQSESQTAKRRSTPHLVRRAGQRPVQFAPERTESKEMEIHSGFGDEPRTEAEITLTVDDDDEP